MNQHSNPIIAEKLALADEIERYCEARGIQPSTFGRMAGLGGDFFGRLRDEAKAQRWETLQKAREHIANNPIETGEAL
jgi:hypothetical protein